MRRSLRSALCRCAALFTILALSGLAQAEPGSELRVALITFGPGSEVWERFGHNALLIEDAATGTALTYNYGIFDFEEEDFFLNFARGRMTYRIDANEAAADLPIYVREGRWIVRQDLVMTPAQRASLRDYLSWNLRPENARYRYDYYRANCSTRVRDALDKALGGAIKAQIEGHSRGYTYRLDTMRLMEPETWLAIGMDMGLGPSADARLDFWDESFVPMTLMSSLRDVRVAGDDGNSVPLVAKETLLAKSRLKDPPDLPFDRRWLSFVLGASLALSLLRLYRRREQRAARVIFAVLATSANLLFGIGGLLLLALWGLTEHTFAWRNENLLLFNPLCLLLPASWWRTARASWRPSRWQRALTYAIAALAAFELFAKVLPWFEQSNLAWIALILPVHLALARVAQNANASATERSLSRG